MPSADTTRRALRIRDVADRLGVHPSTIRRMVDAGELHAFRVGRAVRIRAEDVDQLIDTPADSGPAA